ncbi:MAG: hypothetical protein K6B67_08670 [Lachnospiraceae bacterium]|nr:hypothetical protein [Lachnospiraceae bacterium]
MKFTYEHLELNNVLKFSTEIAQSEKVAEISDELLDKGLYTTSPKVFRIMDTLNQFEILLSMNREINEVPEGLEYIELLRCKKCIYTRYLDYDTDYSLMKYELDKFAEANNLKIKNIYIVQIPIPGGIVNDVYAEV